MNCHCRQIVRLTVFVFISTLTLSAWSETWSDASGKFSIDAKFVGVEGKSIVLLKPDGKKISVPIAKLSEPSREQAKQLYRANMRALDAEATSPADNSTLPNASRPARVLDFQPPIPPAATAKRVFPDGLSVQQTLDFIKEQFWDGHPEVIWDAIPNDMQATFDDPQLRDTLDPFMEAQSQIGDAIEPIVFKAIQVLVTKKDFVLGSSLMVAVPPDAVPTIRQGYDPAVGIVYEVADLAFSLDLKSRSVSEMMNDHGPRIGSHLKQLLALAPPNMVDGFFESISIEQLDSDQAIIRMPSQGNEGASGFGSVEMEDTKLVRVSGRWVPEEFVDQWRDLKAKLESGDLSEELQQLKDANEEQSQGAMMFVGMMAGGVGTLLDGLVAAKTQQEFDAVIVQASAMLPMGVPGE